MLVRLLLLAGSTLALCAVPLQEHLDREWSGAVDEPHAGRFFVVAVALVATAVGLSVTRVLRSRFAKQSDAKPAEPFWAYALALLAFALGTAQLAVWGDERPPLPYPHYPEYTQASQTRNVVRCGGPGYAMYCASCHTLDGTINVGPSFKGLYGSTRKVLDTKTGEVIDVVADDAYIIESILDPGAKLSRHGKEFGNLMDQTLKNKLGPEDLQEILRFLKERSPPP